MDSISEFSSSPTDPPKPYDLCVFIGRFQPFHQGHASVVRLAFTQARHVLLLIGSATAPPSHHNPFSFEQRVRMIFATMRPDALNLHCQPVEDSPYNDTQWVLDVQRAVDSALDEIATVEGCDRQHMQVSLIGASEQRSAFYLNRFPGYDSIAAPRYGTIMSAPIRTIYFSEFCQIWLTNDHRYRLNAGPDIDQVSTAVREFLTAFATTAAYRAIRDEYEFIQDYREQWANVPHPVTMVTVDAVVIQSGHVLLVQRETRPGHGLWALPGGFLPQNRTILDAMVQTLLRETNIAIYANDLRRAVVTSRVFDAPHRDPRGRVITHGFRLDLPAKRTPTRLRPTKRTRFGADDLTATEAGVEAETVKWFPLSAVRREMMFLDHLDIIKTLGGL